MPRGHLKQLIFIRHAEKDLSDRQDVHLNHVGRKRAEMLRDFFLHPREGYNICRPDVIYAMKQHGPLHSLRPVETVAPLAEGLGMLIVRDRHNPAGNFVNTYYRDEHDDLVRDILSPANYGKTVLVCWEHKAIVHIVNRLGIARVRGWGLNPQSSALRDTRNYTAVWVFTPEEQQQRQRRPSSDGTVTPQVGWFEVYRQFDIHHETLEATHPAEPLALREPLRAPWTALTVPAAALLSPLPSPAEPDAQLPTPFAALSQRPLTTAPSAGAEFFSCTKSVSPSTGKWLGTLAAKWKMQGVEDSAESPMVKDSAAGARSPAGPPMGPATPPRQQSQMRAGKRGAAAAAGNGGAAAGQVGSAGSSGEMQDRAGCVGIFGMISLVLKGHRKKGGAPMESPGVRKAE